MACVCEMSVLFLHQGINVVLRAMCQCILPMCEWFTQTLLHCFSKNRNATNLSTNWYFLSLGLFHPTPLARRLKLEVLRTSIKPSFKQFFKNPTSSDNQSGLHVTDPSVCPCYMLWLSMSQPVTSSILWLTANSPTQ